MNLQHGIDLFNSGEFFAAHEAWEAIWIGERGPRRLFVQALIHFAVGYHHDSVGNRDGAQRQLRKGLRKLAGYLPRYESIDTGALYRHSLIRVEGPIQSGLSALFPSILCFADDDSPGADTA